MVKLPYSRLTDNQMKVMEPYFKDFGKLTFTCGDEHTFVMYPSFEQLGKMLAIMDLTIHDAFIVKK